METSWRKTTGRYIPRQQPVTQPFLRFVGCTPPRHALRYTNVNLSTHRSNTNLTQPNIVPYRYSEINALVPALPRSDAEYRVGSTFAWCWRTRRTQLTLRRWQHWSRRTTSLVTTQLNTHTSCRRRWRHTREVATPQDAWTWQLIDWLLDSNVVLPFLSTAPRVPLLQMFPYRPNTGRDKKVTPWKSLYMCNFLAVILLQICNVYRWIFSPHANNFFSI